MSDYNKHQQNEAFQGEVQEDERVGLRAVILVAVGLVVAMFLVLGAAAGLVGFYVYNRPPAEYRQPPSIELGAAAAEPRLQANPAQDMASLRAAQMETLNGYAWVDQESGIARIPLSRAMEIVAGHGLPFDARSGQEQAFTADESGFWHPELDPNRPVVSARPPAIDPFAFGDSLGDLFAGQTVDIAALVEAASPDEGGALFQQLGCGGCHSSAAGAVGPDLAGIFGQEEELEGSGAVLVDETYLYESIADPHAKIVLGFQPVMPGYTGQASPEEIAALIAYIKSLTQ